MAVTPIPSTGGAFSAPPLDMARTTSGGSAPFSSVLEHMLQGASQSHANAQSAVQQFALGQTDNLHGVMLQVAQADLAFRLILEIRNRLTDAFQDVMKMQV